jgi:hypothetical protein
MRPTGRHIERAYTRDRNEFGHIVTVQDTSGRLFEPSSTYGKLAVGGMNRTKRRMNAVEQLARVEDNFMALAGRVTRAENQRESRRAKR